MLASRDAELNPLRQALAKSGKTAELHLVRRVMETVAELERLGCDAVLVTAHVSHLHLAQVLAELHRREPLFPVLFVARGAELAGALDLIKTGLAGVVPGELPELLGPTLEREIRRFAEVRNLRHQQQRLQWLEAMWGAAPVALAVVDAQGVVRWANAAYGELAALTPADIESARAILWTPGDARWAEVLGALRADRPWSGALPFQQDETAVLHQFTIVRLARSGGETWYVVARRAAGTEIPDTPAQVAAAQRHELFAAIAGGIAHDLNNILAPITMAANLLGEQELSVENDELVRTIEHGAERGAAVIRQVLTFAHGSENCELVLQPRYLLREVARLAAEIFPPDIGVRAELPAMLWSIVGDPAEIHQAMVNVLLNARDALPEGGHIAVSARNVTLAELPAMPFFNPQPGDFVEISVEDTGAGMDPEVSRRVWEPFVTTKGPGCGAGLGLSRVAGVLRSHGGFGQLQGGTVRGTKVSLFFPRGAEDRPAPAVAEPEVTAREAGRILLVDDEEEILSLGRRILERAGYEVLVASDGREALGVFMRQRTEIGLVLTDLAMPGMNGFTLIWALRRAKPDLRVLVATGQGTEANLRELELMGVREVLLKPFTAKRLLDAVASTLAEQPRCEPALFLDAAASNPPTAA